MWDARLLLMAHLSQPMSMRKFFIKRRVKSPHIQSITWIMSILSKYCLNFFVNSVILSLSLSFFLSFFLSFSYHRYYASSETCCTSPIAYDAYLNDICIPTASISNSSTTQSSIRFKSLSFTNFLESTYCQSISLQSNTVLDSLQQQCIPYSTMKSNYPSLYLSTDSMSVGLNPPFLQFLSL
jgi:hypothetical protein